MRTAPNRHRLSTHHQALHPAHRRGQRWVHQQNVRLSNNNGSSLVTTLVAGAIGLILLVVTVQAVTAIILWIQLNALANHAATLAASDLGRGNSTAIDLADASLYASGVINPSDSGISWHIDGNTVSITLVHHTSLLVGTTAITAHGAALIN